VDRIIIKEIRINKGVSRKWKKKEYFYKLLMKMMILKLLN
jgi:hypothetical protein